MPPFFKIYDETNINPLILFFHFGTSLTTNFSSQNGFFI